MKNNIIMNKDVILALLLFIIAQTLVWLQLNGQFVWPIFKKIEWLLILTGLPITWLFLAATRHGVSGFDGLLWPQRFLAFACGIIIFSLFTWFLNGEGFTMKTILCLLLSVSILGVQILWK